MIAGVFSAFRLFSLLACAQTTIVGDAWTAGRMGAGTSTPAAALEVVNSTSSSAAFQVSGVDETPFLQVASSGTVGIGQTAVANLDITGSADSTGIISLELHNGNLSPSTGNVQVAFGVNGTPDLMHAIRSEHSSSKANNSLDFLVWTPAVSTTSVGSLAALSLVTTSTSSAMHVMPATGTVAVELVVSDGSTLGAGTIHRALEAVHSSRALKADITYLTGADEKQAYDAVLGLKHVSFRYKRWNGKKLVVDRKRPLRRGLIYEEAPDDVKGPGGSLVVDERLLDAELAAKELIRRLEALRSEVAR